MSLAGYGNISATSYSVSTFSTTVTLRTDFSPFTEGSELSRKIFVPVYLSNYRYISCVDTGSDITILHYSVFAKIFKNTPLFEKGTVDQITTFSGHNIPVKGEASLFIKINPRDRGIFITVRIIDDIPEVPTLLLGNDFLKAGLGIIQYTGNVLDPIPEVAFTHPEYVICTVYYESPRLQHTCMAVATLEPYECKPIEFFLQHSSPVLQIGRAHV